MRIDELKEKIKGLTGEIRNLTNSKVLRLKWKNLDN